MQEVQIGDRNRFIEGKVEILSTGRRGKKGGGKKKSGGLPFVCGVAFSSSDQKVLYFACIIAITIACRDGSSAACE